MSDSNESLVLGRIRIPKTDERKRILRIAWPLFAMFLALPGIVIAGGDDYRFEPVMVEIKASNAATLKVRLIHKPSGTPVAGVQLIETRLMMPHHGSADMVSTIASLPDPELAVFAFKAPMMMEGNWLLSIAAKVPGESEVVTGSIVFRVNR
jgi:YtkA-like